MTVNRNMYSAMNVRYVLISRYGMVSHTPVSIFLLFSSFLCIYYDVKRYILIQFHYARMCVHFALVDMPVRFNLLCYIKCCVLHAGSRPFIYVISSIIIKADT